MFRAEPHDTARHLAQYTSLDAEFGFVEDHHDVMAMLRDVLAGMVAGVAERAKSAAELLGLDLPEVPARIPEIHFADAQNLLAERTGEDPHGEPDLAPAHERWLSEWAREEHGSEFLYVTGYPMAKRPFYTHPDPDRPAYSGSFDLLFRGLELVTGGQRPHRHADYLTALEERGEEPGGVRRLPAYLRARDAAARRLRDRPRTLDGTPHGGGQHPADDAVPARPPPAQPVASPRPSTTAESEHGEDFRM